MIYMSCTFHQFNIFLKFLIDPIEYIIRVVPNNIKKYCISDNFTFYLFVM